ETYPAPIWTVLERFGYYSLRQELNGTNIHRPENIMTMNPTEFDALKLYFTAAVRIIFSRPLSVGPCCRTCPTKYVSFSTPDSEKCPLPSSTYLALHAACVKVAHLSGAAK
ncbi:hypothetical protein EDC04DRAFT_2562756, partial [Pisolithus marmoratus]